MTSGKSWINTSLLKITFHLPVPYSGVAHDIDANGSLKHWSILAVKSFWLHQNWCGMKPKERARLQGKGMPFALPQISCRDPGLEYQEGEQISWKTFEILMNFADFPMLQGLFTLVILAFECLMCCVCVCVCNFKRRFCRPFAGCCSWGCSVKTRLTWLEI